MAVTNNITAQHNCAINVDTNSILADKNLDAFIIMLDKPGFVTFTDNNRLPQFIKQQLYCLTTDSFSIADRDEAYKCCCTSAKDLPKRQLLFFSINSNHLLITYLTGGIGVSTTILMLKFDKEKILDIWAGKAFPKFASKKEVIEHIKALRKKGNELHGGYVSI